MGQKIGRREKQMWREREEGREGEKGGKRVGWTVDPISTVLDFWPPFVHQRPTNCKTVPLSPLGVILEGGASTVPNAECHSQQATYYGLQKVNLMLLPKLLPKKTTYSPSDLHVTP